MKLQLRKTDKPLNRGADVLLITADGKTLKKDLAIFLNWEVPHDTMCIGRSIKAYPGIIQHYADVDSDAAVWVVENLKKNHPTKINGHLHTHTLGECKGFSVDWDVASCPWPAEDVMWHGSTALFAVLAGLEMGYSRIILAGAPLDSKGHWYYQSEAFGPRWTGETYQAWFEFAMMMESGNVKSLSGYTRQILGEPKQNWLCNL